MEQSRTRVALLIDGDNNSSSLSVASLLAEAGKLGEITIRRVYGNWSLPSMRGWQDSARDYGFEQRHHGQMIPGKNATDIALAIDAMDILYSGAIEHFCLVASDSDYRPLILRLRSAGCKVLGIGKPTAPLALRAACTTFVFIDQLSPVQRPSFPPPPSWLAPEIAGSAPSTSPIESVTVPDEISSPPEPLTRLIRAYEEVAQRAGDEWIRLSDIGNELKRANALIRPKVYGHKDLFTFVTAYPDQFETRRQSSKGKPVLVRRKQVSPPLLTTLLQSKGIAVGPRAESGKKAAPASSSTPAEKPALQTAQPHREGDLSALLLRAYRLAADKRGEEWVPIPNLSAALRQLDPQFKATAYGDKNLPALVQRFSNLFRTRRQTEGTTKHVEVCLVAGRSADRT